MPMHRVQEEAAPCLALADALEQDRKMVTKPKRIDIPGPSEPNETAPNS